MRQRPTTLWWAAVLAALSGWAALCVSDASAAGGRSVVLDTGSFWRCHFTWKTEQVGSED